MNLLREYIRELLIEKKKKGLWDNIHAKRKRGERPAKPGEKGYPKTLDIEADEADGESRRGWLGRPHTGRVCRLVEEAKGYSARKPSRGGDR